MSDDRSPAREIRVLGGLAVFDAQGEPIEVPAGAVAKALALLALRRVVHVEELTEVLWPEVEADVGRRRLRNVLHRLRAAAGPIVSRKGDRVELARDVEVDHHRLEDHARRALALDRGPDRLASLFEVLAADSGPLLPEVLYEEWADAPRQRADRRRQEILDAISEGSGAR